MDARADLYALGCVGYLLLTGALVFEGENAMQLVLKHIQAEPVPPSIRLGRALPSALEQLMMRCLAKTPADRPPDATTVAEVLGRAGADEWTQRDARGWWETTFTPPARELRGLPPTELLEIVTPQGAATS